MLRRAADAVENLLLGHADAGTQHCSRLLDAMRTVLANQNDVVGRTIVYENAVFAIENSASRRNNLNLLEAILVCELDESSRLRDLKMPESGNERQQHDTNDINAEINA